MRKTAIILSVFLFCASSIFARKLAVTVFNPVGINRVNEIVEISQSKILKGLTLKKGEHFIILDNKSKQVPYQVVANLLSADSLVIFPATVAPRGNATYTICKGIPDAFKTRVYGRLVPERKDDFTWENDRVAYRVYGPALQATGEISNGMDFWAKRTDKLVVDRWYADELAHKSTYHTDNGEGLDFYKVGRTLGIGATAPYVADSLCYGGNFIRYRILDKGPLRITVKLEYAPFTAGKHQVAETRIISLDAGNQLNKISVSYQSSAPLTLASGIVLRDNKAEKLFADTSKRYVTHAEPNDSVNGTIFGALVSVIPFDTVKAANKHVLAISKYQPNATYTYYAGGGWSKYGFKTFEDWTKYVKVFSAKIRNPLRVSVK